MPIDRFFRFAKEEDGAVAIIVSLLLVVMLGFTALGIDAASLYRKRAHLQDISDLTAVSAMAVPKEPTPRSHYVLSRNGKTDAAIRTLQTGRFLRNPLIPVANRFSELPEGSPGINAVRVVLQDDAPLHFSRIFTTDTHLTLDRTSLATRTGSASFSLGSHLVALDGEKLNSALTARYGASAAINLGAIEALASTSVNLGDLLSDLDSATGGPRRNPAEILNASTTAGNLVTALRAALPSGLAAALGGLNAASAATSFDVASLVAGIDVDLGLTAAEFLSDINVSALDIVRSLVIAQKAGDAINLSAGVTAAGVISTQTIATAGEPVAQSGVIALGEEGTQLHRAAARLRTDMVLAPGLLTGLGAGVRVVSIKAPIYTEIAGATATLDELGCNLTAPQDIAALFTTAATPLHPANGTSVAALYLGELPSGSGAINPADLGFADLITVDITIDLGLLPSLKLTGLTIQARSKVTVGASLDDTITFKIEDVANGDTRQTFGSGALVSSAINSLLSPANTELRVKPSQAGLVSGLAAPVVNTLLAALPARMAAGLATAIDAALDGTLDAAGVDLGAGELTLISHHCEPIRLVR